MKAPNRNQTTTFTCVHCSNTETHPKGTLPLGCHCGRRAWRAISQQTEYCLTHIDAGNDAKQEYELFYDPEQKEIIQIRDKQKNILASLDIFDPLETPQEIMRIIGCSINEVEEYIKALTNAVALDDNIELKQTTNFYLLAHEYYTKKPIHYDESKIWWEWSNKEKRWIKSDETNILVRIDRALPNPIITIKAGKKHELLEALRRIARENKPKNPPTYWVQYKNKTYDLNTGEVFESTPKYFNKNTIPWEIGHTTETPILDKLFKEWVVGHDQDESWVQTLYEIIAYCTLRTQPAQRIVALIGQGANGKGTFLKVLKKFLGEDNTTTSDLKTISENRFAVANLYGKLAVFLSEADEASLRDDNQLKRLTGDDLALRYEFKGKDAITEISYCTCMLATNALPLPPNKGIAYYRRWLVIDFPHQFSLTRNVLDEIPDREYNALAAKCLEISKKLLKTKAFTNEGTILERTARYDERANPILRFVAEECVSDDPDDRIVLKEFCDALNDWLGLHSKRKLDHRVVGKLIKSAGYELGSENYAKSVDVRSSRRVVKGLRWKIDRKTNILSLQNAT